MNLDDFERLKKLAEAETDPDLRAMCKKSLLAIAGEPARQAERESADEKRKAAAEDREATRFNLGLVGLVIGGVFFVGLLAAGHFKAAALAGVLAVGAKVVSGLLGRSSEKGK